MAGGVNKAGLAIAGWAGSSVVLSNFHDLAAIDATTDVIINVITAVGQFQRYLQNELTVEWIAAAEAQGRYRGRPPALTGARLEDGRSAFQEQGASIAALARTHEVSRVAILTSLAGLLPDQPIPPPRSGGSRGRRRGRPSLGDRDFARPRYSPAISVVAPARARRSRRRAQPRPR
ncbi:hypothetical protein [Nonomuraea lactucae]|uniref:hypothetical protein n=1 Tax=Nonomuraea lactucae TaxID=2249762 RepID=UPI001962EFF7|nr:hypothetical protein [Nonomuraea lactucae]